MFLHACPRCGGDLYVRDYGDEAIKEGDSRELVCMQCGRVHSPKAVAAVLKEEPLKERQRVGRKAA